MSELNVIKVGCYIVFVKRKWKGSDIMCFGKFLCLGFFLSLVRIVMLKFELEWKVSIILRLVFLWDILRSRVNWEINYIFKRDIWKIYFFYGWFILVLCF